MTRRISIIKRRYWESKAFDAIIKSMRVTCRLALKLYRLLEPRAEFYFEILDEERCTERYGARTDLFLYLIAYNSVCGAYFIVLSTRTRAHTHTHVIVFNALVSECVLQHSDASIFDLNDRFAYGGTG